MRKLCVVFTATVKPSVGANLINADERLREAQYVSAIKANVGRLRASAIQASCVVVENSDASAGMLEGMCREFDVRLIRCVPIPTGEFRGKGQGEAAMLRHMIEQTRTGESGTGVFLKITGRLELMNIVAIAQTVSLSQHDCMANVFARFTYADTRVMGFTARFWAEVMLLEKQLTDASGHYLEHVVVRAIRTAAAKGMRHDYLIPPPRLLGRSATTGQNYTGTAVSYWTEYLKVCLYKRLYCP